MASVDSTEPIAEATGLPIMPDEPGAMPPPAADTHQPFRFTSAANLSTARQEILEAWHRPFLRIAAANLRSLLRLEVELEVDSITVDSCAQALSNRPAENQGAIFRLAPQADLWLLDMPLPLAGFAIERMLGGTSDKIPTIDKTHELTELEQIIFQQFCSALLGDYARNFAPHHELSPEIIRATRTVRVARVLGHQPDDLLVKVGLSLVFNKTKTPFSLLLPIAVAEDLLQRLGASENASRPETPTLSRDNKSPIASVPVPVAVRWQGFQITLAEVAALAPGDLLVLDAKKCDHGVVYLGDRARFAGKISREAHKTVITLTHPLE